MTDPSRRLSVLQLRWFRGRMRLTSVRHAGFLKTYASDEVECFVHDLDSPVTAELRRARFDVIVLDTTFLCARFVRPRSFLERTLERYAFVAKSDAVKLAFPQDEYDHSEILEQWLAAWGVDAVFTVLPAHRAVLYPRLTCEVLPALTGYVDDNDLAAAAAHGPLASRTIDVGYRARDLSPQFGRHGRMKAALGERFLAAARGSRGARGLNLDVSVNELDAFMGAEWPAFLARSRFQLGCESGSSILDPRGVIADSVRAFVAKNPHASFEEVEAACFPGRDGVHVFSAISPRLFETATAGAAQILVPGHYNGLVRPWEHYFPLDLDMSNLGEVLDAVRDLKRAQQVSDASRVALLDNPELRYSHLARIVVDVSRRHHDRKGAHGAPLAELQQLMAVDEDVARKESRWRRLRDDVVSAMPPRLRRRLRGARQWVRTHFETPPE